MVFCLTSYGIHYFVVALFVMILSVNYIIYDEIEPQLQKNEYGRESVLNEADFNAN
jgi:hypothetical protein